MNKIKKGDSVIILTGSQKKTSGTVLSINPEAGTVIVSGINVKKSVKKVGNEKKLVAQEYPINASNVALKDPKSGKPTRVGFQVEGGKKVRIAKASGQIIK
jgi:large subunit ribosomal protein L24